MSGRLLLGAASIAFVAVAGAARAADVMPVVVPMITPVPVVAAAGPEIEITLETGIGLYYYSALDIDGWIYGDVVVTTQSGWGIGVGGWAEFYVPGYDAGIGVRVFREVGNFQIGLLAGVETAMGLEKYFGPDVRYETDTIEALNQTYFVFNGGFSYWGNYFEVTFTPSDRIEIYQDLNLIFTGMGVAVLAEGDADVGVRGPVRILAGYDLEYGFGPTFFGVYGGLGLDFNGIKPFIVPWWENDGGLVFYGVDLGVEIEREIGDGPFTVFGWGEYTIGNFGQDFEFGAGIRFEIGDE